MPTPQPHSQRAAIALAPLLSSVNSYVSTGIPNNVTTLPMKLDHTSLGVYLIDVGIELLSKVDGFTVPTTRTDKPISAYTLSVGAKLLAVAAPAAIVASTTALGNYLNVKGAEIRDGT